MYYSGSTKNIEQRLKEHNSGKAIAIKNKSPWIVKFVQKFSTIQEARRVEYKLKRLKRRDYIEQIIKDGVIKIQST